VAGGLHRFLNGETKMRSLGEALKGYVKRSGLASRLKHQELYRVWRQALRERADRTRITSVRSGTLEVEVDSAALVQELEFERRNLEKLLQAEVAQPFIERIYFRLGSFEQEENREDDEG